MSKDRVGKISKPPHSAALPPLRGVSRKSIRQMWSIASIRVPDSSAIYADHRKSRNAVFFVKSGNGGGIRSGPQGKAFQAHPSLFVALKLK
jgi:hypothetical protein